MKNLQPQIRDGYEALEVAVVIQAVKDYKSALKRKRRNGYDRTAEARIAECEQFFREGLSRYSEIDGEEIIDEVRERVKDGRL